ncbi:MAG TPA: sarcosine oxidase subunit gamma, partial [Rhodospirillales bacterium]|nr:sarcosine oxidase subunit gamma [Rhodospirillales bacterium]
MVKRVSALAGHYHPGPLGTSADVGITLGEIRDLELWQMAAWPETLAAVGTLAAETIGVDDMP